MRLDRDSELRGGGGATGTCPGSSSMAAACGERGPQLDAEARKGEARRGAGRGRRGEGRAGPTILGSWRGVRAERRRPPAARGDGAEPWRRRPPAARREGAAARHAGAACSLEAGRRSLRGAGRAARDGPDGRIRMGEATGRGRGGGRGRGRRGDGIAIGFGVLELEWTSGLA
ncbi:hypothetical protein PVAP13_8NG296750 [Panicum virgatum]|uniref:Uncharacterized protein n=1 Tax=Panicum virgatum TaxID=38727 RepID=A0A8T0PGY7_PANVG|nr:hypothetical protein PVAP13_8NG296750 [Panicum virgatum]